MQFSIYLVSEYIGGDIPKVKSFTKELRNLSTLLEETDPKNSASKALKLNTLLFFYGLFEYLQDTR